MTRKRAPGGGRKPSWGKDAMSGVMTIRMPGWLREQLEKAASENKRTITAEIMECLSLKFPPPEQKVSSFEARLIRIEGLLDHLCPKGEV